MMLKTMTTVTDNQSDFSRNEYNYVYETDTLFTFRRVCVITIVR